MKEFAVTLSFDIEEFDFPIERKREIAFQEQIDVSSSGTEFILSVLEAKGIKATFYVTANFSIQRKDLIQRIVSGGHEICSHDYYHSMSADSLLEESKKVLEDISCNKIHGYRAPRLLGGDLSKKLLSAGYKYNSSINPTWIPGRYNNLFHPRKVTENNDGLLIYPVSVAFPLRIPLFWLALHIMPLWIYRALALTALKHDRVLNLYFHPWEFSSRLKDPKYGIPFYVSGCSGIKYQEKFKKLLYWLERKGVQFMTTSEYLNANT